MSDELQNLIQELEYYRIHVPLPLRHKVSPLTDGLIVALIDVEKEYETES